MTDFKLRHWDKIVAKEAEEKERAAKFNEAMQAEKKQKAEEVADKNDVDRILKAIAKKADARFHVMGGQIEKMQSKLSTTCATFNAFLKDYEEFRRKHEGMAAYSYAICRKVEDWQKVPGVVKKDRTGFNGGEAPSSRFVLPAADDGAGDALAAPGASKDSTGMSDDPLSGDLSSLF